MVDENTDEIGKIKREIILLKREIEYLKFKNSRLFKVLNIINLVIFIIYIQFILSYLFDLKESPIPNSAIQFNVYHYPSASSQIKIYTIKFKYNHYYFKSKINKELNKTIVYSDAAVTKDIFFQMPQKIKLYHLPNRWFFVNETLGILTICSIIVFVQSIAYLYKQNEQFYPLFSISMLSILSFLGISIFSLHIHNFI
ncbi:MAG: hypothetical protein Fur0023_14700 [Bacteroidia bacterium]